MSRLLGTGSAVRALVRSPDSTNLPGEIEVVRGDMSEPATLEACLVTVGAVFLVWSFLTAEAAPAVQEALRRHARRIVYLSSMRVNDDRKRLADPINRFHADIERLIEESGLEWAFLRSCGMASSSPPSRHLLPRTLSRYQYGHRPRGKVGGRWTPTFPRSRCLYLHNRRLGRSGRRDRNKDGGRKCYSKARPA